MRATQWIAVSGFLLGAGPAYAGQASPTRGDDLSGPGYDDVSYGDIPRATFGAAVAPAADTAVDGHDDVSYGTAPHGSFALALPAADETAAPGHDDVTYPTAEPRRSRETAIATSSFSGTNGSRPVGGGGGQLPAARAPAVVDGSSSASITSRR
jgi:hypothetical protein